MATNLTCTKRKCSLILASTCLGLVLYHIYWAGEIPGYSLGSQYNLPTSQVSKAEDDVEFEPQNPKASSAAAPTLPPEYSTLTEGQQKCDLFFTTKYLEHTATHQQPYCDAQSPSAFQCFTAPRLVVPATASWGQTDPLCIAQGVTFEPEPAGEARDSEASKFNCEVYAHLGPANEK